MRRRLLSQLWASLHVRPLKALVLTLLLCNIPQVGNFLSDRPSSRVLAPPGGASQVFFG